MSWWTYINGTILVSPMGRSQPEKRYILDTVLEHLPRVTGSEGDMEVYVQQRAGHNSSSSHDEFGMRTNNLRDWNGRKTFRNGWHETQGQYIITVWANLRDRHFEETKREFMNWLCRLAKRVFVEDVLVNIKGDYDREWLIKDEWDNFAKMHECPSWAKLRNKKKYDGDTEPNWCEFMMWDRGHNSDMPMLLEYKYYIDEENDAEVERRMRLWKELDS